MGRETAPDGRRRRSPRHAALARAATGAGPGPPGPGGSGRLHIPQARVERAQVERAHGGGGVSGQTGARAYGSLERKKKKRTAARARKGRVSARRRRSARDSERALRARGLLR